MGSNSKNRVSLYVKDTETFRFLADEVAKLYYERYGEFPTQAETIEKSLRIAKDFLSDGLRLKKRHNNIEDFFGRT